MYAMADWVEEREMQSLKAIIESNGAKLQIGAAMGMLGGLGGGKGRR
jgi:hypothetical protein